MKKPHYVRPSIPDGTHPVDTFKFVINSNPITDLKEEICNCISMNVPGLIVHAPPRIGKTWAIKFISNDLKAIYGSTLPIINFDCECHNVASESKFYQERLSDLRHNNAAKGNATVKKETLINYMTGLTIDNPSQRLIVFMDEAQNMITQELKWLVGIYNKLQKNGVIPTFILFGQPELANKRNVFVNTHDTQIVGRFMVNVLRFRGLQNENEVKNCLEQFDECEYPMGSGWTYTRYFFPVAFANGWRLASQYQEVWRAFVDTENKHGTPKDKNGLPMQYFISTVCRVLRTQSKEDNLSLHLSLNIWKEAVKSSGYNIARDYIRVESDPI